MFFTKSWTSQLLKEYSSTAGSRTKSLGYLQFPFHKVTLRLRCFSVTQSCLTLCDPMNYSMPGFLVLHYLPKLAQTYVHWVSDAIQPFHCPPVLLSSFFASIRIFSNDSVVPTRWPKCWSFSFSISPSNEYSELISFRIDWFDLLAVHGTLKSLLQHHGSKASILWHSASLWSNSHIHTWPLEKP